MRRSTFASLALSLACAALAVAPHLAHSAGASLCDPHTSVCRRIKVYNNCEETLWVAAQGNAVYCASDSDCPAESTGCDTAKNTCNCSSDSECAPTTQVCDTAASPARCEYAQLKQGGWRLKPGKGSVVFVPNTAGPSQGISWNGRIWARTGCPAFGQCHAPGTACSEDSQCCTNAGCQGLFTCTDNSECSTWSCTSDSECPGGSTCNGTTQHCDGCVSGTCACKTDTDCRDGGTCQGGLCTGQCGQGGIACHTGDCGGKRRCEVGTNGQSPVTLAELALLESSQDTYDVSQVDGFNVPVKIAPMRYLAPEPNGFVNAQPWCGVPGCARAADCPGQADPCSWTTEGSCLCSWDLGDTSCPSGQQAVWPLACEQDSDCGPQGTCGTTGNPKFCTCTSSAHCPGSAPVCGLNQNVSGEQLCGTFAGCFNPNNACSIDATLPAPLDCPSNASLLSCTSPYGGSCYTNGVGASCCGCPSWSPAGDCHNHNTTWQDDAEPLFAALKNACPTAYSFQYDDPTSTFNCQGTGETTPVGYAVTFCPCGSPGARAEGCSP